MNHGYTASEIAEVLTLPPGLASDWSARGYYGTVSHNAKAVYQKYIGWYDGNPATLHALPPADAGKKYVDYMGGADAVLTKARDDFRAGNYRWVAEVTSRVVFADPANREARALLADAFEQMGYLAESATWRNAYLAGADEIRNGRPPARTASIEPEMLRAMPIDSIFDVLGTHVNGPRASSHRVVINWRFSDTGERLASTLENGALTYVLGKTAPDAHASATLTRPIFEAVVLGQQTIEDALDRRALTVEGDASKLAELMSLMDQFDASFPLVEPRNR